MYLNPFTMAYGCRHLMFTHTCQYTQNPSQDMVLDARLNCLVDPSWWLGQYDAFFENPSAWWAHQWKCKHKVAETVGKKCIIMCKRSRKLSHTESTNDSSFLLVSPGHNFYFWYFLTVYTLCRAFSCSRCNTCLNFARASFSFMRPCATR